MWFKKAHISFGGGPSLPPPNGSKSYLSAFFPALANSLEVDAAFTSLLRLSSEESHVLL